MQENRTLIWQKNWPRISDLPIPAKALLTAIILTISVGMIGAGGQIIIHDIIPTFFSEHPGETGSHAEMTAVTSQRGDLFADDPVEKTEEKRTPLYQPDSHLVYAAGGADVDTTIINGRVVMENRRLLSLDVEEVMDAVNRIAVEIGGAAYRPSPRDAN